MDQHNEIPEAQPQASQDLVEIRQEDVITINDALLLAAQIPFSIGKSTLQRWAKVWHARGAASAVKCLLVTTRTGSVYKLHRQDFEAWVLEQKENDRSREIPQDLERSLEASSGSARSHQASQDIARPQEASRDIARSRQQQVHENNKEHDELLERLKQLEDENLQLKIDIGVRRELIKQAKDELDRTRAATNSLLRENGALEFQIRQLAAPAQPKTIEPSTGGERVGEQEHNSLPFDGDNRPDTPFSSV